MACNNKMESLQMNETVGRLSLASTSNISLSAISPVITPASEHTPNIILKPGDNDPNFSNQNGEINVWSWKHIGILFNYFAVGIMYGVGTGILYPILVVKNFESPSFVTSAGQLTRLFWVLFA